MKVKIFSNLLILTALCLVMEGCEKSDMAVSNIVGCWINPVYVDNTEGKSIFCYEKSQVLSDDFAGIQFMNNGTLIERKNAGWCGTPPIAYSNYSGNWQTQKNGNIKIDVAYWGGMEHITWKIIEITDTTLKIEIVFYEDEMN